MKHFSRIAVIAALLSFSVVASAADSKDKKDEQICTYEAVVGSHFPRKVCTSASQRAEDRKNSQERFGRIQDFNNRGMSPGGSPGR
ncbi:MAG TPA: hypothetical protein VFB36_10545 [Nevskiaceae bacterium]|nr:hypothetical protein [Nevskiaceae bacterium]